MTRPTPEERRLSFGQDAAGYDAYRPPYAPKALAWLVAGATRPVADVVDVGAGTGKLTEQLHELGYRVTAVEPDAAMLAHLKQRIPGVVTIAASAEHLPLETNAVDAVTVGQAWHWFDPVEASAEFNRVVRPGGVIGVMWNDRHDVEPWLVDLRKVVGDAFLHDYASDDRQRDVAANLADVERRTFEHVVPMSKEAIVGLVRTFSYVRLRDDADAVYQAVAELLESHPDLRGREVIDVPYQTTIYRSVVR